MKAFRIALASILCLAMALSMVACEIGSGVTDESVQESLTDEMVEKLKAAAQTLDLSIELENKELKWLSWDQSWNYNEGTAEGKLFKESYGGYITAETCAYDDRYSVLAQKVASAESPDMFPFEEDNYPCGVISGMYEPLDDYMTIDGDKWGLTKDLMEKYVVGGKHYVILPYSEAGEVLVYNRDTIEQYGLDDPWTLFEEGKWDWNAMYDMLVAYCNHDEDRYGIGGWWPEFSFVATTGTPFVALKDGKLQNNLESKEVAKAMNFLGKLYSEGLNYPWEKFDWGKKINFIKDGKMLFYAVDIYELKSSFRNVKKTSTYTENVFIAPFPKDPDADKYYQALGTDAHMLVAGAKNPKGVAIWQDVRRVAHYDETITEQYKQEQKINYNYTDELIRALNICEGRTPGFELEGVYDFRRGINAELNKSQEDAESVIKEIERSTYKMGKTWNEVLSEYAKQIATYIDQTNADIDKLSK